MTYIFSSTLSSSFHIPISYTYRSTSWKVSKTQTRILSAGLKKKVSNAAKIWASSTAALNFCSLLPLFFFFFFKSFGSFVADLIWTSLGDQCYVETCCADGFVSLSFFFLAKNCYRAKRLEWPETSWNWTWGGTSGITIRNGNGPGFCILGPDPQA